MDPSGRANGACATRSRAGARCAWVSAAALACGAGQVNLIPSPLDTKVTADCCSSIANPSPGQRLHPGVGQLGEHPAVAEQPGAVPAAERGQDIVDDEQLVAADVDPRPPVLH